MGGEIQQIESYHTALDVKALLKCRSQPPVQPETRIDCGASDQANSGEGNYPLKNRPPGVIATPICEMRTVSHERVERDAERQRGMSGVGTIIDRPECLSIVPCLHDNAAKKGSRTKKRYHCSKPLLSLRFLPQLVTCLRHTAAKERINCSALWPRSASMDISL